MTDNKSAVLPFNKGDSALLEGKTRQTVNAKSVVAKVVMSGAKRDRRPARERYAALIAFVAFACGEDVDLPGIPLRYTRATIVAQDRLASPLLGAEAREWVNKILRQVAEVAAKSASGTPGEMPPMYDIALPPPPAPRLRMIGAQPVLLPAHNAVLDLIESLSKTLEQTDASRLKICPICSRLFVALNFKSKACTRRCSNTWRQREFWTDVRAKGAERDGRVLTATELAAEYRQHAAHNRKQRRNRKQLHALRR